MVVVVTVAVISILTAVLVVIFFVKGTESRKKRARYEKQKELEINCLCVMPGILPMTRKRFAKSSFILKKKKRE